MKKFIIGLLISNCVLQSTALRCYIGYSAFGLPLEIGVRDIECEEGYDHCTTVQYTLGGIKITKGNCAKKYGQAMCQFMRKSMTAMTDCEESLCDQDNCNTAVYEGEQVERKRVGALENTLKCTTGLMTQWPAIPFAKSDIPMTVDECFPETKDCVTIEYDVVHQVNTHYESSENEYRLPTIQKMCNRHNIDDCQKWCNVLSIQQKMENCKVKCCQKNNCNA